MFKIINGVEINEKGEITGRVVLDSFVGRYLQAICKATAIRNAIRFHHCKVYEDELHGLRFPKDPSYNPNTKYNCTGIRREDTYDDKLPAFKIVFCGQAGWTVEEFLNVLWSALPMEQDDRYNDGHF